MPIRDRVKRSRPSRAVEVASNLSQNPCWLRAQGPEPDKHRRRGSPARAGARGSGLSTARWEGPEPTAPSPEPRRFWDKFS